MFLFESTQPSNSSTALYLKMSKFAEQRMEFREEGDGFEREWFLPINLKFSYRKYPNRWESKNGLIDYYDFVGWCDSMWNRTFVMLKLSFLLHQCKSSMNSEEAYL